MTLPGLSGIARIAGLMPIGRVPAERWAARISIDHWLAHLLLQVTRRVRLRISMQTMQKYLAPCRSRSPSCRDGQWRTSTITATDARVRWFYNALLWHDECLWVEPAASSPDTSCHLFTQGKDLPRTSSKKQRLWFRTTTMFLTPSCSDFEISQIVTLWSTSTIQVRVYLFILNVRWH